MIQQIVPAHVQGRVAVSQQVLILAAVPIGAALGGYIADGLGLRATVAIAALGTIAVTVAPIRSPLWTTSDVAEILEVANSTAHHSGEPPAGLRTRVWDFKTRFFAHGAQP
jgi:predicted MFS family arabinose efflux permease